MNYVPDACVRNSTVHRIPSLRFKFLLLLQLSTDNVTGVAAGRVELLDCMTIVVVDVAVRLIGGCSANCNSFCECSLDSTVARVDTGMHSVSILLIITYTRHGFLLKCCFLQQRVKEYAVDKLHACVVGDVLVAVGELVNRCRCFRRGSGGATNPTRTRSAIKDA